MSPDNELTISFYLTEEASNLRLHSLVHRINSERIIVEGKSIYSPCSDYWKLPYSMQLRCAIIRE